MGNSIHPPGKHHQANHSIIVGSSELLCNNSGESLDANTKIEGALRKSNSRFTKNYRIKI